MIVDPIEVTLVHALADALAKIRRDEAHYYDWDAAWVVLRPQMRYLGEHRTVALVHPGGAIYTADTSCKTLVDADLYVTAARRIDGPELPWEAGYEAAIDVQFKLVADIKAALHGKRFTSDNVYVFLTDRDVIGVEADGWAVAQAQLSYQLNVVD